MKNKKFNKKTSEKNLTEDFKNLLKSIDDYGSQLEKEGFKRIDLGTIDFGKINVPYYPPTYPQKGCPNCGYCQHCGRGGNFPDPNKIWCGGDSGTGGMRLGTSGNNPFS